jgi:hypothetical protein
LFSIPAYSVILYDSYHDNYTLFFTLNGLSSKSAPRFSRPSGTGDVFSTAFPALKRWAIVECPSGTGPVKTCRTDHSILPSKGSTSSRRAPKPAKRLVRGAKTALPLAPGPSPPAVGGEGCPKGGVRRALPPASRVDAPASVSLPTQPAAPQPARRCPRGPGRWPRGRLRPPRLARRLRHRAGAAPRALPPGPPPGSPGD